MNFYLELGNFLDEFYKSSNEKRENMIKKNIFENQNSDMPMIPLFAATVHKLANDYNLEAPNWIWNKECYSKDTPFYDCNAKGNLRLLFNYKSPIEFKHRNLFVDENFLKRV